VNIPVIPILRSRDQYYLCHIRVPDAEQRLAAIQVSGSYYSFFRIEKDEKRALTLAGKLHHRGDRVLITKIPKGYAIWVLESEAEPVELTQREPKSVLPELSYVILISRHQYQPCHIQVPDLEQRLSAIYFEGQYYSLFKVVEELDVAKRLVKRLAHRKEMAVITQLAKGYGVWVLESDAKRI
jgi:hypothetical protein